MNTNMLRIFVASLAVLIVILIGMLVLSQSGLSEPVGANLYPAPTSPNPYPGPQDKNAFSTLSPEEICAQWFVLSTDLPPEKFKVEQEDYQLCVESRKTVFDPDKTLEPPVYTIEPPIPAPIPRRKAGLGTILETSLAPFPSMYGFFNQWFMETDSKIIRVFSGAQKGDGVVTFERPWQGYLIVVVASSSDRSTFFPSEGGHYKTPSRSGPIRIIDADGSILTLLAENGDVFVFDVANRQFLSYKGELPYRRNVGNGVLIEDDLVKLATEKINLVNQWYTEKDDQRLTVLAGQDDSSGEGMLLIVTTSMDQTQIFSQEAFRTPIGSLRIFDVQGDLITLISGEYIFKFDLLSKKFVAWPEFPPDFHAPSDN